ncbi:phage-related protein [Saccharothrix coeruleofusca]|uniref:transglycosylase SLT domain-containing protein n=1 Tax=Saccharothrix coeruleofusca TaxID=33919 RepID=UPI001AE86EFE|nr:transglycosylase SLT domain-containing protein [Saccharothrix coeruleofusca]MBP2341126.1 phage-related protein [Saccharothrix coeruleofusca]
MAQYQAGTAFVPVIPSLKGFQTKVKSELAGMKIQATGDVKIDVNKAALAAATSAIDKMAEQVKAARAKEADAAGVVRAAEAKLQELRDSGKAKTSQLVVAEEQLESARRKLAAATDAASKAQSGLVQAQRKAAEAETAAKAPQMPDAEQAGRLAGGKFAAALRKQVAGALDSLPTPTITADSTPAEREIADLRQQLQALGDARIGVDVSAAEANARLEQVKARLLALGASSADIQVEVDAAAALAALGGVESEVDRLDGRRARVDVDVDDRGTAGSAASGLNGVFGAGMKLGALVPVIGGVGAALAGLGGAALVGIGALGVAALALAGVGGAYSALGDAELSAGDDAAAAAKQQAAAAAAVVSAQDRVRSATASLANTRAQAADAQIRAEQRVAQAETSLVQAQRAALRAQQDLNKARLEAQRALEDLAFQVEDGALAQRQAVLDLADAESSLAEVRSNPNATAEEQERALLAYEQAANQLERLQITNQRLAVDKAAADKAGVEGSEQVVRAQEQVQSSTDKVAAAQQALADAVREQAAQQRQAAYSITQAEQGVVEAQRALQQAMTQTGDVGSASARKVRDAFAELSPAAASFATFLYGMKPQFDALQASAAGGFLPQLQAGLQALMPVMPVINQVIGQFSSALGGLARQALEALASPYWVDFFTMLGTTAGPLMTQFGQVLGQVAMLAAELLRAFMPVAPVAMQVIGTIAQGLQVLAPFLGQVAQILTQGLLAAFQALMPAMGPVGEALVALAGPVAELAGQLGAVLAEALIALVPIITELAPPLTDLIRLVGTTLVTAISALAPVIADVAPLIGDVVTLAVGLLSQAVQMLLPYLDDIAALIGQAVVGAIQALMPVLPALAQAWMTIFQAILPILPALIELASALIPALLGLIPPLVPVLIQIADAFAEILPQLVPVVLALVEGLVPVITALAPLVKTVFEMVAAHFQLLFRGIVMPILEGLVIPTIRILAEVLTWLWRNIVAPVFEGIGTIISWAWENVIRPVFDKLNEGIDLVGKGFEKAVEFIRQSWDKLKEIAAKPVNFIIETVYNNGIRALWNKIADFVGLGKLDEMQPVKFAGGGVLGGYAPGRDVVPALLSPGEAVLVPELVRALGPANILAANAAASGGRPATVAGFSGGGVARFAGGGIVDTVLGFVGGLAEDVVAMFKDPIGWIKTHIGIGDSPWIDMIARAPAKLIGDAVDWLWEKINPFTSGNTPAGPAGSEQLSQWIRAALAFTGTDASWFGPLTTLIMRESGGNPNARNDWDINAQNGIPSQGLMQTIPPTFAAYRDPRLPNNILDPIANIVAGINYIKARYGSIFNVQQANAGAPPMGYAGGGLVFDQGGWLPPGPSAVYNGTGRPEVVLTGEQWQAISAGAAGGVTIHQEIHPQPRQSETEIGQASARYNRFALAQAGGPV